MLDLVRRVPVVAQGPTHRVGDIVGGILADEIGGGPAPPTTASQAATA